MLNVFIDSNIFLSFYRFTSEHINKLENVVTLIERGEIKLYLTEQVGDEFNRNREDIIKRDTLDYVKSLPPNVGGPLTSHNIQEIKEISEHIEKLKTLSDSLYSKLKKQMKEKSLPADLLAYKIFSLAEIIPISQEIFKKAKIRFDRGNPPGKKGSYGDAINWEVLLKEVPQKTDLCFISGDKDFSSNIEPGEFDPFLKEEWIKKKASDVKYYTLISKFLSENFPIIKITKENIEEEKKASERISDMKWIHAMNVRRTTEKDAQRINKRIFALSKPMDEIMWLSRLHLPAQKIIQKGSGIVKTTDALSEIQKLQEKKLKSYKSIIAPSKKYADLAKYSQMYQYPKLKPIVPTIPDSKKRLQQIANRIEGKPVKKKQKSDSNKV